MNAMSSLLAVGAHDPIEQPDPTNNVTSSLRISSIISRYLFIYIFLSFPGFVEGQTYIENISGSSIHQGYPLKSILPVIPEE